MNILRKEKPVKEQVREAEKVNRSGIRDLEREAQRLDREEAKLVADLRNTAKRSPEVAKPLAKQLVRLRQHKAKLQTQTAHLRGVSTAMRSQGAMHTTATAMGASAQAMGRTGAAMDPAKLAQGMQEFQKQNEKMDMASSVMDDAVEGMFEGAEDEADELVDQVLTEVGIDALTGAVAAPKTKVGPTAAQESDAEVNRLLESLKA